MSSRFLLKLSGEAFGSPQAPLDLAKLDRIADEIRRARAKAAMELAIVPGGGNFVRGAQLKALDRVIADQMGMLATILNGMALRQSLESKGISVILQSAVPVAYAQPLDSVGARHALAEKKIVIFVGGTGNPFVTTDTAAAIRASEIGAKMLLKATNVPGVYSADPKKNPTAKLYSELTIDEAIEKRLNVMDLTALTLCREQKIPICVFDIAEPTNLTKALRGQRVGTLVQP